MEYSRTRILEVLNEYIHVKLDRDVMITYLTDRPRSLSSWRRCMRSPYRRSRGSSTDLHTFIST